MVQAPVHHTIVSEYEERFAESKAMHNRAKQSIAGGIAHDGRYTTPFPVYVTHAKGAYKWELSGHKMIDYAVGHGALILGHADPDVTAAVQQAVANGTHFGAGHEAEIRWAEKIVELVPSAERVRFVASGTEATMMAMRLARTSTGRNSILKFEGNFHGWNDYLIKGEKPPFEKPDVTGVPPEVLGTVSVLPVNDLAMVEERLVQRDIAAIIVEPSGASWGTIPLEDGFLAGLRDLADKHSAILIFDEVITGFRYAPGGAQQYFGVTPDVTTMAKIVAGGLPGGAVGGRADIMEHLAFKDEPGWNAKKKVIHPGTFNANPATAVAGRICLDKIADGSVQRHCEELAVRLRAGMNGVLEKHAIRGCAWGESSIFHIILGAHVTNRTAGDLRSPEGVDGETLKASGKAGLNGPLALALNLEGVDLFNGGGMTSLAHTDDDIDFTVAAFERALLRMRLEGMFA